MHSPDALTAETAASGATWEGPRDWPRCVAYRPHLARTAATALVVGTVLFAINHLDAVLRGHAGPGVWTATAVSYVVPFCVANIGMLAGCRREPGPAPAPRARPAPTWRRLREVPRCVLHPPYLARTAATALVVGTVYFAVNQLGAVLHGGPAAPGAWAAGGVTYLVPFCVSNAGLLIGRRRPG
jgi:hypothetical protein